MAEQNKRTYDGVYNSLKQISDEEGVDFGLDGMSQEDFRKKYFTGPGNIENLYHRLNKISNEEGIDFGQGSRDEWLSSFGYKRNADGQKGYQTLDGRPVGRRKAPKPQQTPAGGAAFGLPEGMAYSDEVELRHNSPSNVAGSYKDRAQIASEVQSEGLPAYRQGSKKPVQRDASSYGIPYRPDIELTAAQRDEIEQQNGYAAKQVKQMRQQSEKNQRRRNQPVIDTGDENVNRHIIKTQGQWEDELMNGVNDLGRKYVSPMIEKALKKADNDFFGVFEQASRYPQMQGMELATLRRANERVDPDKFLQGLQKSLEKTYSNPEMLKDIEERANAAGIPKDEYLKQVVIPSLQDQLVSEFTNSQIAKHMPKNATEYILQGMSNSIGGMLMGAATETEAQRRYKNEAAAMTEEGLNPHYTPGTGAKLAQMGVSFAADAPFFGFYGKVGGNVAKGLAERQIRKLTAKGLSEGAARSIVGTALENSVGQRMKNYIMQHVVSSSITMGGYNATSETARQVRDREFKPGQIIGSTAEGLATGAAFGLTGGAVQALSQPLSGIARIGSKVGGYLVEGETMYTTEELAKMVHGEEGFTNPFEGSAEAMMKLGVMKVSSPGGLSKAAGELFHPIKSNRRQQTGVRFTPEEEAYVRESAEGKSLLDALSQMHPEVATTEVKGKRQLTAEGEQMRQQLSERYNAFMGNTEIPYAVKAKVAGALGGLMPDAAHTPLETGADIIHNADGSVILKTRDKDGNCMQELKFDSFSEADNWREEHEGDFRLNDAVNMWNSASTEARANTIKQLMDEYGIGEEEAATMVKSALGGSMGKDFSNDQLLYVYNTVRDNAYPVDEPNTRRNYWEGQKLTPQERHQAMVEAQQAEDRLTYMDQAFADEIIGAADYPDEKIAELAGRDEITGEQLQAAIDYYNKAARFNGMMEKTAQSVDDQVEAANAFIRRNTHTDSGNVVEVESDGKGYYLTAGKLALNQDGSLDLNECGEVMILRDKDTGEIQVVKPSKLHITALSDPKLMIADNESMDGLRGRLMQEANNSITLADGTPEAPQNGDYFTGADGIRYMAIGVPDEQGNVVWSKIALDEKGEPVGEPKDLDIDEYRKAKSDEIDRDSQTIPEEEIVSDIPETVNHEGEIIPVEAAEQPLPQQEEKTPVVEEATVPDAEKGSSSSQTAFPRIPVVNGKTDWESASTEDSRAALTERYGEEKAREMVGRMIANLKQSYDELLKKDVSKMTDMDKLAAYEDELADIKRKMEYWQQVFEESPAVEVVPEEKPAAEQPQSVPELTDNVPKLTESVPETPESVPSEQQPVIPQEPTPPAEKPAEPQPPVQPQKPTAEQKIAEGSVKANLGKTFELRHSDGRRTEMRLESISPGDRAVVTQTDYDAQGNRIGEPQRKVYNVTDIGGSIIQGAMKPVLSTEEKLRAAYKGRVGILNVIDVLTDSEQEQMLRAYENGDNEALTALMHEFTETHREDIILNERDKRNANVSQIMEGNSSREDKLRRVRKQYQGYDDAVLALSDEAMQPTTLEEYVSDLHSRQPKSGEGPIAYFSYDRDGTKVVGLQDETGHGSKTGGDTKGYAPWLAPKGKGVSLAKYAEQLHEQLPEGIKAQYSDQDVRNAILEVFGGAERPSDITTMVIKRGIIQAEQAARRMEEMWIEGGPSFHRVSIDDNTFAGRLARGKQQTNTEPTEKQKEAGNYKKGHVSFGGYDFVIENPEGSMRRGKDADGNTWEQQMHNTYGYILGKKGKDGDHLDMFINDQADLDTWNGNVYVVDQVNADGSFDEHKIMYGFNSEAEAREAYLSNYSEGWKGLGRITGVDKDTFDKWLDSSDRKIKEFAEHSIIKDAVKPVETEPQAKAPTPAERDKVLMDAVVDKMKEAGIDVSTDWEEGQRVIDEYNGSRELKPMGTTTRKRQDEIAKSFVDSELSNEQRQVVDVFSGNVDKAAVKLTDKSGKERNIIFRQGNERKAGVKHSVFRHYQTDANGFTSEEVAMIPEIIANGERKQDNGVRVSYKYEKDGVTYTVTTEVKGKDELFTNFYTNRKPSAVEQGTSNTENRHVQPQQAVSGAKVQQNPETTKESDEKLKQFKTSDGHAYGFTYKGKIYIDPRIATSETPIHEYGHLWAEMKRQTAPEEWDAIKNVLLNDKLVKPIIDRVKKDYPELAKEGREDDFIEEILTQFSGKRGAERLREIAEQIAAEKGGVFGKAEAVTAMQRLRNVLAKFWAGVAKMMGWKYRNANEIADKMMLDFLEGVNPTEKMKEAASDKVKEQMMGKTGESASMNTGLNENNSLKFQRASNPEPELTPEEKQYWKQWDAAMKKWKERNAIAADASGPGEQPKINQGESVLDYAKRLVAHKRESALWQTAPKLEDFHQVRDDKAAQDEAHANEKAYPDSESAKRWRVATDLARLRHAMSRQKAYDKATVKAVTDFAQDFMKMGFGDNLGRGEMERLLSSVKNATGAKDIRKQVDNIMNILIDNQLRNLDQQVVKLSSVKELKQTAQGVEAQGRLELKGQRMIQAFRQAREGRMDADKIRERLGEVAEKMSRNDDEAPMWEQEYEGLTIALQYQENIEGSRDEWADLDREYKDAMKNYKQSGRSYKAQQELLESLEQAMMENKIERIGMFGDIIGRLQGNISESMQGAKEFVEREKERVKHIQQIANFDLAGKDMGAMREKVKGKPANFFLQPLATFEQMLRQFGSRNANGEGYLFNHFMRSWMDSTDKAYVNEQRAKEELDKKAQELFGDKVKRWSDLYDIVRNLPTMEVEVLDGEEPKTFTLTQGNLLYAYMADKMTDGRMKLRKMGIDEEAVTKIKDAIDPRLVQLGDWLQDEYLVKKRTEYNKVHERMFGAPMAAIDHYFPLRILGDARYQEQDVSNMTDQDAVLPSTITGNIIKRRKNALPLDILHTDALSLAIEHVEDMERWAATAEWNKDINTLLSYTTFRNKVKNMNTIYGSGDALWNTFADTARMAAGTYRPKAKPGSVDSAISNIAKGVTAAKINFRVYTAFKQILSAPAFLHDVNIGDFVKNSVNPYGSWKWAMDNMPVFEKRWKSRQVGDTRLMDDPTDWKMWKTNLVQMATRMGMSPNALVDGVTCAVGARSIYQSRYKKYKNIGASDELAHKRALQDAEIGYNLTQQSSEGAFVSAIQKDRTIAANMLSVFRNSSMAYTRQWVDAARNLKHRTQKGYKEDCIGFMTRQLQEQFDLDENQAKKAAEAEYARAGRHDVARMLNMMFGVTVAWNLGASLPYLLLGDDDETKKEMMTDALLRGFAAGPTEGFAAGNLFSEFISRSFASEQTRKVFRNEGWGAAIDAALKQGGDYEVNPLPLMADIQGMIKKMGYDKYAAAQDVFNICAQSAVGVNPQTFTDMWNACMDYGAPGWDGTNYSADTDNLTRPKEIVLFIMRLMNAPTSSWRNKYIDELGMSAEDAKKLPYDELASRYAHYKHWKDTPIIGWLRGEEGREEKMAKIRKQFDKSVQERIERLDEEEIRQNLLHSKSLEERRMLAKAVASRFGLTAGDDAKKAKEQWQQNYQLLMEYEDIREDAMLSAKKKEANDRGDRKTVKDIEKFQSMIREKGKKKLGGDNDTELMQKIRQWRREALEKAVQSESGQ